MLKFSIYKPGQGLFVRWGTVAFAAIIVVVGMGWLGKQILVSQPMFVRIPVSVAFGLVCAYVGFMGVNKPKSAEFMIMTESEMRKVNWPTRREVFNSTKVVIFIALVLGIGLFIVDQCFSQFFNLMHLYGNGSGS